MKINQMQNASASLDDKFYKSAFLDFAEKISLISSSFIFVCQNDTLLLLMKFVKRIHN